MADTRHFNVNREIKSFTRKDLISIFLLELEMTSFLPSPVHIIHINISSFCYHKCNKVEQKKNGFKIFTYIRGICTKLILCVYNWFIN